MITLQYVDLALTVTNGALLRRISHMRTRPSLPPHANRFGRMSPRSVNQSSSTLGIWDMLTLDKSPMKLRDIVAKPLHWNLRNHTVIPNLKLNLSVRNLDR